MPKRFTRKEMLKSASVGLRYRVTLRLTRAEIDYLGRIARRVLPPARNGKPRAGIVASQIMREALDRIRGIEEEQT